MKFKFNFFGQLSIKTLVLFFCCLGTAQTEWKSLFNGKDLSNWEVRNGTAQYQILNNTIVGTSRSGTPNTAKFSYFAINSFADHFKASLPRNEC